MNKIIKNLVVFSFVAMLALPLALPTLAANENVNKLFGGQDQMDTLKSNSLGGDKDPRDIAAGVINILMGFLGLVAVVIILFGGFKWMTAAGNEDKIDEAKKLLAAGIIGLVIILSAWGIATFVLDQILTAAGGTTQ